MAPSGYPWFVTESFEHFYVHVLIVIGQEEETEVEKLRGQLTCRLQV